MTSCELLAVFSGGLFSIQSLPSHSPLGCTGRAARGSAVRRRAPHAVQCPPRAALRGGHLDSQSRSGTYDAPGDEPLHAPCVQYDSSARLPHACRLDRFDQRVRLPSAMPEDDFNVSACQNGRRALWRGWVAVLAGRQGIVLWLPLPVRHTFLSVLRPQTRRRLTCTLAALLQHAQRLMLGLSCPARLYGCLLNPTAFSPMQRRAGRAFPGDLRNEPVELKPKLACSATYSRNLGIQVTPVSSVGRAAVMARVRLS